MDMDCYSGGSGGDQNSTPKITGLRAWEHSQSQHTTLILSPHTVLYQPSLADCRSNTGVMHSELHPLFSPEAWLLQCWTFQHGRRKVNGSKGVFSYSLPQNSDGKAWHPDILDPYANMHHGTTRSLQRHPWTGASLHTEVSEI